MDKNLTLLYIFFNILFNVIKSNPDKQNAKSLLVGKIECGNNQLNKNITYKIYADSSNKIYRISKCSSTYIYFYEEDTENEPYSKTNYSLIYKKYTSQQLYLVVKFTYQTDCLSLMYLDSINGINLNENKNLSIHFATPFDEFKSIKIKDSSLNQYLIQITINTPQFFQRTTLNIIDKETKNYVKNNSEIIINYFPFNNEISLDIKCAFGTTQNGIIYILYKKLYSVEKINVEHRICTTNPQKKIYLLRYNENKPYYDVSFTNNVYFYDNSILQSGRVFKGQLYSSSEKYIDFKNGGCLQIIFQQNNKIPLMLNRDLFQIFESREFNFEIKDNSMKNNRVNIILSSDLFEVDKFYINNTLQNYFISNKEKTRVIYHFYPISNILTIDSSFIYKENNMKKNEIHINYEIPTYKELYQDTSLCYILPDAAYKFFKIKYNSNKEYIDISSNGQLLIYDETKEEKLNYDNRKISSNIYAEISGDEPCLQLFYFEEKNKIPLKQTEFTFKIFESRELNFEIKDNSIKNNRVNIILLSDFSEIGKFYINNTLQNYFISNYKKTKIIYHYYPTSNILTINSSFIYKENEIKQNFITINYEIPTYEELYQDTSNCYNLPDGGYKFFKIKYNSNKEYIDISSNGQLLIYDEKKEEKLNYDNRIISSILYVEISGNYPCLQLFYFEEKNKIPLKQNVEFTFRIFNNRKIYYYLDDNNIKNKMINIILSSSNSFEIDEMEIKSEKKKNYISNIGKTKQIYHYYSGTSIGYYIVPSFIHKKNDLIYNDIKIKYEIAAYKEITDDVNDYCVSLLDGEFMLYKIKYNSEKPYVNLEFNKYQLVYYKNKDGLTKQFSYTSNNIDPPVYFELRTGQNNNVLTCFSVYFLSDVNPILNEKKILQLYFYNNKTFDLYFNESGSEIIELTIRIDNEKSSVKITQSRGIESLKITQKDKSYIINCNVLSKQSSLTISVITNSKVLISMYYKTTINYFAILLFSFFILIFIIIVLQLYCTIKGEKKRQQKIELREMKEKKERQKKKEEEKEIIKKIEKYYSLISKNPEELKRICPLCFQNEYNYNELENKNFENLEPIFSNKEEYLEQEKEKIKESDFTGVVSYLKNHKCCHFYHEKCKKDIEKIKASPRQSCYFCYNFITITNLIVFKEIDKKSFFKVMKFIHKLNYSYECDYQINVIDAVHNFIQDETFDKNLKEELKKRRRLSKKFINDLDYSNTFEISLKEDYYDYEERYFREIRKQEERRERREEERREAERREAERREAERREIKVKIEMEKEQNKKIRLQICNKCFQKCVICKNSCRGCGIIACYAHNKCWNVDNCIVCGGKAMNNSTRICDICKNINARTFRCQICNKKLP